MNTNNASKYSSSVYALKGLRETTINSFLRHSSNYYVLMLIFIFSLKNKNNWLQFLTNFINFCAFIWNPLHVFAN